MPNTNTPSVHLLSGSYYGVPLAKTGPAGVFTGQITDGTLIRGDTLVKKSRVTVLAVTSVPTTAPGVVFRQIFGMRAPYDYALCGDVHVSPMWTLQIAAGGACTGRWNLDVRKNGTSIVSGAKGIGPVESLNAAGGTNYLDHWHITSTLLPTSFTGSTASTPGDLLELVLEFEIVGTFAASAAEVRLHVDPFTAARELIFEFMQGTA
jgi:hypothetical protein